MNKMQFLKNVPIEPTSLSSLIDYEDGSVISMQLTRSEDFQMMLMAVANGEEVTSEQYPGDTLYYVIDGCMPLATDTDHYILNAGDCMAMKANQPHAIGGNGAFKILQITCSKR